MRKNIIIALLALIVAVESIVMFVDNEQQSLKAETNMSDSIISKDSIFTLLMNENTECYCNIQINFKGDLMLYYGPTEERITMSNLGLGEKLRNVLTAMLENKGLPKENESIHLALDVRTPKDSIEKFKRTLMSAGIYECELIELEDHSAPVYVFGNEREIIHMPSFEEVIRVITYEEIKSLN